MATTQKGPVSPAGADSYFSEHTGESVDEEDESEPYVGPPSLDDVSVSTSKYLFDDCNSVDWCWQPVGRYKNLSTTRTITYLEVVYVITAGNATVKHVDRMLIRLKPGQSTPIMSGKYNYSFRLSFYDNDAAAIGPLLGSTYVNWWPEVRYIRYAGNESVGTRVG